MADLLPSTPDVDPGDDPRVIGIDSEDAEDLLAALSSETARRILAALHVEPRTPARLAEEVDTSLQNAQYHLDRLESAGVIEVGGTAYSEKGREMDVYAPADRALVVVAGREEETAGLQTALERLLGGVGVLGVASVVLDRLLSRPGRPTVDLVGGNGSPGTPTPADAGGAGAGAGGSANLSGAETAEAARSATAAPTTSAASPSTTASASTTATPSSAASGSTTAPSTTAPSGGGFHVAEVNGTATPAATHTPTATHTATPAATSTPTLTPAATHAETATHAVSAHTTTAVPASTPVETAHAVARTTASAAGGAQVGDVLTTASPGLLFFLGGATVLLAWFVLWAVRRAN